MQDFERYGIKNCVMLRVIQSISHDERVTAFSMKIIPPILTCFILAISVGAIAILSVQNATPVSVAFLTFQSIKMPVGVVLALSVSLGLVSGVFLKPLWQIGSHSEE